MVERDRTAIPPGRWSYNATSGTVIIDTDANGDLSIGLSYSPSPLIASVASAVAAVDVIGQGNNLG